MLQPKLKAKLAVAQPKADAAKVQADLSAVRDEPVIGQPAILPTPLSSDQASAKVSQTGLL